MQIPTSLVPLLHLLELFWFYVIILRCEWSSWLLYLF